MLSLEVPFTYVMIRFGGASFPPKVYYKVFLNSKGTSTQYVNGRHLVQPNTQVNLQSWKALIRANHSFYRLQSTHVRSWGRRSTLIWSCKTSASKREQTLRMKVTWRTFKTTPDCRAYRTAYRQPWEGEVTTGACYILTVGRAIVLA